MRASSRPKRESATRPTAYDVIASVCGKGSMRWPWLHPHTAVAHVQGAPDPGIGKRQAFPRLLGPRALRALHLLTHILRGAVLLPLAIPRGA